MSFPAESMASQAIQGQLIGVPPAHGQSPFAKRWVRPTDPFRPCPDPEITGYTDDWGRRRPNIGFSGFVIRQGANLKGKGVASAEDDCRRLP